MSFGALRSERLEPGMKIGLYGGSFDPVHEGHLHVADTALTRLGLDRIWWVVSPQNPHKPHAPGEFNGRLEAVRSAANAPRMVVSDIEARLGINRTAQLATYLTRRHPGVNFVWIMGADALRGFHRWQDWQTIAHTMPIAVVSRPPDAIRARLSRAAVALSRHRLPQNQAHALPGSSAPRWTYLTAPLYDIASSTLRVSSRRATTRN